jgi:hypothetical protein
MSLKSIEMQIAIPRTLDAGKLQEQLQQRGQHMNDQANEAVQKDVEYKRSHVIKSEKSANAKLLKDGQKHNQEKHKRNDTREMKEEQQNEQHPYKGTIIDYSG